MKRKSMKKAKTSRIGGKCMFILYSLFLLMLSVSLLLMPMSDPVESESRVLQIISGGLFWLGLIGTVTAAVLMSRSCKKASHSGKDEVKGIGLIRFFKNTEALAADIVMFVAALSFIISRICTDELLLPFIFLSIFVFSFGMHCMLNGKNYISFKNKNKE